MEITLRERNLVVGVILNGQTVITISPPFVVTDTGDGTTYSKRIYTMGYIPNSMDIIKLTDSGLTWK